MRFNTLLWEVDAGILTLTLNRPEQMNSFTVEMANELFAAFNAASEGASVRAVVVTGAGRAFCAGMDLSREGNVFGLDETLEPTMDDMRHRLDDPQIEEGVRDTGGQVVLAIYDCKKPIIAAISGAASRPMAARTASRLAGASSPASHAPPKTRPGIQHQP